MLPEIILIVVCAAVIVGVLISFVIRKKKGKCSCDCGGDCPHCAGCVSERKTDEISKK